MQQLSIHLICKKVFFARAENEGAQLLFNPTLGLRMLTQASKFPPSVKEQEPGAPHRILKQQP